RRRPDPAVVPSSHRAQVSPAARKLKRDYRFRNSERSRLAKCHGSDLSKRAKEQSNARAPNRPRPRATPVTCSRSEVVESNGTDSPPRHAATPVHACAQNRGRAEDLLHLHSKSAREIRHRL